MQVDLLPVSFTDKLPTTQEPSLHRSPHYDNGSPVRCCFRFRHNPLRRCSAQPGGRLPVRCCQCGWVDGFIQVVYAGEDSSTATITATLDFSGVDQAKLAAFDGNCTEAVTSYKWHIHTKWNSTQSSDLFKQCSKAATDNHYDPLKACGTASEYIAEPECNKARSLTYACNPANYTADPLVCEKGDLSGKFGAFVLSEDSTVSVEWTDVHYPLPSENTATWSIVLHAVCGKETPRIACAVGQEAEHEYEEDSEDGSVTEHEQQEECEESLEEHEHHEYEYSEGSEVDEHTDSYINGSEVQQEESYDHEEHEGEDHEEQEEHEETYGNSEEGDENHEHDDAYEQETEDGNDHDHEQTTGEGYEDEHNLCA